MFLLSQGDIIKIKLIKFGWGLIFFSRDYFPEPIGRYIVKENYISSVVTEILWYKQTDIQTDWHPVTFV